MVAICPCCRQTVQPSTLLIDTDAGVATRNGRAVKLSPHEARALEELHAAAPGAASHDGLACAIYRYEDEPVDMQKALHLMILRLRRKIAPLGIGIASAYGTGYRLDVL